MENASQALVIAGGVLIGILIISLSMYLYTNMQSMYSSSIKVVNSAEVAASNSFFSKYGVSGCEVSALDAYNIMSKILDNNANEGGDTKTFIKLKDQKDGFDCSKTALNSVAYKEKLKTLNIVFYYGKRFEDPSDKYILTYEYNSISGAIDEVVLK